MSEQAKILIELQEIIMRIIKSGSATAEEGARIDALETLLQKQKCYKKIDHEEHEYQGEEIAQMLFTGKIQEAVNKLYTCKITAEDFFGFIEYHDEDEEYADTFTPTFVDEVKKAYQTKCDV